jgi:RNA polymerase sigma-70 factor (ECF subfamily)
LARELEQSMVAYQAGSATAFETLYTALRGRLFRYLLSLCLNQARAEDLLQECFLQIHRSRHTYLPGRPVLPWAFGIARHVFLMERRARARRQKLEDPSQELPEVPIPAEVERLAEQNFIRTALVELPGDTREALLLHHIWGFSFREIGAVLGIRAGTAKVRAHRGMQRLRRALATSASSAAGCNSSNEPGKC